MMPKRKLDDAKANRQTAKQDRPYKGKKKKKKGVFSRVLDEAWDVIEDIFD